MKNHKFKLASSYFEDAEVLHEISAISERTLKVASWLFDKENFTFSDLFNRFFECPLEKSDVYAYMEGAIVELLEFGLLEVVLVEPFEQISVLPTKEVSHE